MNIALKKILGFLFKTIFLGLGASVLAVFVCAGCHTGDLVTKDISTQLDQEAVRGELPPEQADRASGRDMQEMPEEKNAAKEPAQPGPDACLAADEFFVPCLPAGHRQNPAVKAKGIYVTANSAGLEQRFQDFMDMVEATELNAMVIDVKNDHGVMAYPSQISIVKEVMEDHFAPVRDIRKLLHKLEQKDIYPIARIVVFRDPRLPQFYPEWSIQKKEGGVWTDRKGFTWTNPYEKNVWDYNIAIAKEAALMGFREIQFDYVRFPEHAEHFDQQVSLSAETEWAKEEVIRDFLVYARQQLKDYNVYVSADVFGVIATYITDKDGIGQSWEEITSVVDYIYPMVYPSHYGSGFFGLAVPDAQPTETIHRAMEDAIKRNATVQNPAPIRPWLQGFTATWIRGGIPYTPARIREQIEAALDRGIEEFFIWNAQNKYDIDSFLTQQEALQKQQQARAYRLEMGFDHLHKTKQDNFEQYLVHISQKNWVQAYPYHAADFKMDRDQFFQWTQRWTFDQLDFDILDNDTVAHDYFEADVVFVRGDDRFVLRKERFGVLMENKIWKIRPSEAFLEALTASY